MTSPWWDLAEPPPREPLPDCLDASMWSKKRRRLVRQVEDGVEQWFRQQEQLGNFTTDGNLLVCANDQRFAFGAVWGRLERVSIAVAKDSTLPLRRPDRVLLHELMFFHSPVAPEYVVDIPIDPNEPVEGWRLAGRIAAVVILDIYAPRDRELASQGGVREFSLMPDTV